MTYFSLLYQNKEQECRLKEETSKQLFILDVKDSDRQFQLVGNKLVEIGKGQKEVRRIPCYFNDLNVNQIIDKILRGCTDYELINVFYETITDSSLVKYRQDIFRDLDNPAIYDCFTKFNNSLTKLQQFYKYANEASHPIQQSKYILDAICLYQDCLHTFINALESFELSCGLANMKLNLQYTFNAINSSLIFDKAAMLKQQIENIHYSLSISENKIRITFDENSSDFCSDLTKLLSSHKSTTRPNTNITDAANISHTSNTAEIPCIQNTSNTSCTSNASCISNASNTSYASNNSYTSNTLNVSNTSNISYASNNSNSTNADNNSYLSSIHKISFFNQITMNALELKIVEILNKKYSTLFKESIAFTASNDTFMSPDVIRIYNEMKFYIICHDYFASLKEKNYTFTYPLVSESRALEIKDLYDLNLALVNDCTKVVKNDFQLSEGENGVWITGANQGGKTTFARNIGQLAYLASLGLPVPASYAKLPLFTGFFTHFSIEENAFKSNGKLKEELLHLQELITYARSGNNLIILNELFSSSTTSDAYDMSLLLIDKLIRDGFTVLCVTHIPRLATQRTDMISIATVLSDDSNNRRTYRFIRKEAELTAYAEDIARKYQLSNENIKERLGYES